MLRRLLVALFTVMLLGVLVFALPVEAAETIRSFHSDIVLSEDGSVDVTETITVNAEGIEIRRGIFRDIPTIMRNDDGLDVRSALEVISVERNGRDEPFSVEGLPDGFERIRIGSADSYLSHGTQTYTIRYAMTRMGRMFEDHDELYWNVTGNYWVFPIDKASASVTLPNGAVIADLAGYTGPVGSTEQAVSTARTSDSTATFRAKRALRAGEGMTVAVSFQKGLLVAPQGMQKALNWLSDYRTLVLPLAAVLAVLGFNLFAWWRVGRDPAKGTIIPLYTPPKGFSPALLHYIHERGWKQTGWTAFTASIFDLGVKGLVTINNVGKTLSFSKTDAARPDDLPPGEATIYDYLISEGGKVTVNTRSGPELNKKRADFVAAIEAENRAKWFNNNTGYSVLGLLLAIVCLAGMVWFDVLELEWLIMAVVGGFILGLLPQMFNGLWKTGGISRIFFFFWMGVIGFNLIGSVGPAIFTEITLNSGFIAALSILAIAVLFAVLMRAPTVQGRKVMDQIDGLLMYLNTAEEKRLNFVGEPPMTVKRFESILPHAIALGVEKPWSKYFESELARNAVADYDGSSYSPNWYSGRNFSAGSGFSNTVGAVASGMSAAMIAAQPVSSSSSGFSSSGGGGGGSSGGGGGGGGGGGW